MEGTITETTADEVAEELKEAKEVMIVPGYGMAVDRLSTRSRTSPRLCGQRTSTYALPFIRWPAACPAHERIVGRGQRSLRHRFRNGRD